MPLERYENLTQDDLYAKANEIRDQIARLRAELKLYIDEIGRRDAEAAEAKRAGWGQAISSPDGQ